MEFEITTTYTRRITKYGAYCFWKRFVARDMLIGWSVAAGSAVAWTALGIESPWVIMIGGLGALLGLVGVTAYFVVRARSLDLLEGMGSPVVEWRFSDDGLTIESELSQAVTKWRAVKKVWLFRDAWLLFFSKVSYSTLPVEGVPPEVRAFVLSKVREAGGTVSPEIGETRIIDF